MEDKTFHEIAGPRYTYYYIYEGLHRDAFQETGAIA
jgi:hypothetical protein